MNVLIVNESEGKALIKTRRALSKYLPQLGSNTWAGPISSEGLMDLREKLKAGASKSTAICCHRVVTRARMEVEWFIGSRKAFNEDGRYAFRTAASRVDVQAPPPSTPCLRFATALLRIAALFHDLGKASAAFNAKLKKGKGAEVLRHDLLSFLIIAESLFEEGNTDVAWLETLAKSPALACRCVTETALVPASSIWLEKVRTRLGQSRGILLSATQLKNLDEHKPGLLAVLWLVLTHHRLPNGDDLGEALDAGGHLNVPQEGHPNMFAPLAECIRPAKGTLPWQEQAWLQSVAGCAAAALEALREMQALPEQGTKPPPYFWAKICAHLLRPTLILADHIASMQAAKGGTITRAFDKGTIFANTYDKKHAGDSLLEHLLKVQRTSRRILHLAVDPSRFATTVLPPKSKALSEALPAAFSWQKQLQGACEQAREIGPTFVGIIAETGAGKTLGGMRAINALSRGKLRFTLALGLRSLTWQSARSFLSDARLDDRHLTVAVGNPQTLGLAEAALANQNGELTETRPGSESSEEGGDLDLAVEGTPSDLGWIESLLTPAEAHKLWGAKALAVLSAPVLACTTDHLVQAVSLLKGGDARLFLRLTSSDLVLDEIDAYSASDLQSLGKLVFVAGLMGRHVVVMSATLGPYIFQGLYSAWAEGIQCRAMLYQTKGDHSVVFAANTAAPMVLKTPTPAHTVQQWTQYVETVCTAYADPVKTPQRRQLAVWADTATSQADVFNGINYCVSKAHDLNAVLDLATNKKVSVGCVRLNTAKSAWHLAKYFADTGSRDPDTELLFIPYHSKFPRNYLGVLDATLAPLTNRKCEDAQWLKNPALQRALANTSKKNVVIVVCATTIVETGRDFDFDWGIWEPMSARGLIQFIGRIRRHRTELWKQENIFLLSRPLRCTAPPRNGVRPAVWGQPGIEDALPHLKVTIDQPAALKPYQAFLPGACLAPVSAPAGIMGVPRARPRPLGGGAAKDELSVYESSAVFPLAMWTTRLDAEACLQCKLPYAENRIGYLEHTMQMLNLTAPTWSGGAAPPSLHWYLTSLAPLNSVHAQRTPFRGRQSLRALFIPRSGHVYFYDPQEKVERACVFATVQFMSAANAFIPDLAEQAALLATDDPHIVGCALRAANGSPSTSTVSWSPVFGFLE